jgi:cytoskeletal protein CcmA (bactofilin family)
MFGRKMPDLSRLGEDKGETVISSTTNFKGSLKADGLVTVHGQVEGEIETAGTLVVGKTGKVQATVTAQNVAIAGMVEGTITAAERLEIGSGGKMLGDVTCASLVIDEGGFFHGRSTMQGPEAQRLLQAASQDLS